MNERQRQWVQRQQRNRRNDNLRRAATRAREAAYLARQLGRHNDAVDLEAIARRLMEARR